MAFSAELKNITKSFGKVKANEGIELHVRAGTIHALVGENGAGKSTLMKMMFGMHKQDSGEIFYDGKRVGHDWNPKTAFKRGIGMVHQHFMLAGPETVLDNLVLGVEKTGFLGVRKRDEERAAIEKLMKDTGLIVDLDAPIENLRVGSQSRVEILKVLYRNAKFLILDEPTSVLTPNEVEEFLKTLVRLRSQGCTILIVTHKLKEIMTVADDATVIRQGKTIAARKIKETSVEELSELMVGRKLALPKASAIDFKGAPLIASLNLGSQDIELRSGVVTGIAGVEGNGQEKLVEILLEHAGEKNIPLAVIPADRHHEGLLLQFSLTDNLRLNRRLHDKNDSRYVKDHKFYADVETSEQLLLKEYDVRPPTPSLQASMLSGGNQQKLIVGRELSSLLKDPNLISKSVVLAIHPTRGVDLGAIEFIHGKLIEMAAKGAAVLLISSELEELMSLSHRMGAIYREQIAAWFDGPSYDEKKIGFAMLGGSAK